MYIYTHARQSIGIELCHHMSYQRDSVAIISPHMRIAKAAAILYMPDTVKDASVIFLPFLSDCCQLRGVMHAVI